MLGQSGIEVNENIVARGQNAAVQGAKNQPGRCIAQLLGDTVDEKQIERAGQIERRHIDLVGRCGQRRHGFKQGLEVGVVIGFDTPRRQAGYGDALGNRFSANALQLGDERVFGRTQPNGKVQGHGQAAAVSKSA